MLVQVLIGGGENHRMGLYDMVLVKDNHIAVAGGIPQAITAVDAYLKQENLDVGVEVHMWKTMFHDSPLYIFHHLKDLQCVAYAAEWMLYLHNGGSFYWELWVFILLALAKRSLFLP